MINQLSGLLDRLAPEDETRLTGSVWAYFNTKNQYDTLQFLQGGVDDLVYVSHEKRILHYADDRSVILPLYGKLPLRYFPRYAGMIWRSLRTDPGQFNRMFHFFTLGIGYYEIYCKFLKLYRPRMIILSNDHGVHCRALVHAANAAGIPTIFFQHASIKEDFPPMRFRYACLEGRDTLDKYREIDPASSTDFRLIGMPKFDGYFAHINRKPRVRVLGIPYGHTDSVEDILTLTRRIAAATQNLTIRLRPHPADKRPLDLSAVAAGSNLLERSDPTREPAFDFLRSVDMIVSGNSSIHLEAVLLNVMSVYYSRNAEHDVYHYVANGLVDEAATVEELIDYIRRNQEQKEDNRHRAKYYYAPLSTEWDGRAGELGRRIVGDILAGRPIQAPSPPAA